MKTITTEQKKSLFKKWTQNNYGMSYRQFRATAEHKCFGDALMIKCGNIWVGIESDGYTHS